MKRVLPPLLLAAGFLLAWQLAADSGFLADTLGLDPLLVPSPSEIATALVEDRAILTENALVTLGEVIAGFGLAVVLGVAAAILLHLNEPVRRATYPLVVASQTIPVIVIAPILVVWFGYGIGPKLAVIALICFFPLAVNTLDGLRSVPGDLIDMMRSLDAGRTRILTDVELPAALPYLFSGAKIAVAVAVIGAVFGEWVGASSGLGYLMLQDNAQLETARLFASVFLLSVIALALFALVASLERLSIRWR